MAVEEYLIATDIQNIKIKQMYAADAVYIQSFIDSTNLWYEGYANTLDVALEDIAYPVSQIVLDLLRAELNTRVGAAHIGGSDTISNVGDVYEKMYNLGMAEMNRMIPRINASAIKSAIPTRESDTVIFGRIIRS